MKITGQIALALLACGFFSTAGASTYNFNLVGSNPNTVVGNSETLYSTPAGLSITLSGYVINSGVVSPSALYAKNQGGDEIGIGLNADPSGDHEIFANSFVQVDLSSLLAQHQLQTSAVQLTIGSVQSGEGFQIFGSNTAGTEGTLLMTGTSALDDVAFNIPSFGQYNYVSVSANGGNILLDTIAAAANTVTYQSTPEPATLLLGFVGVLVVVASKCRRKLT